MSKQAKWWLQLLLLLVLGVASLPVVIVAGRDLGRQQETPLPTLMPTADLTLALASVETSASPTLPPPPPTATSQVTERAKDTTTAVPPTFTPEPTATAVALPPTASAASLPTRLWPAPDVSLLPPPTPIPSPIPPFDRPESVVNILLLGNDVAWAEGGRTDTMLILSIDQEAGTASLLSLPRDLYVYVPGWTMSRLNTALPHGNLTDYPGGGIALLQDTLLYNFGIETDYYVRVGFRTFKQIIDALGGVEVVVNCALRDWRLKEPGLDPNLEESWEMYTLPYGIHRMDGDLALWYARSRRTTNDFERGRRQQQLLRAMLDQAVEGDLVAQTPALWQAFQESVDTDMTLDVILQLAAVAPQVQKNGVQSLHLSQDGVRKAWRVPTTGEMVQLLQWEQAERIFAQLLTPPSLSRAARPPILVEVVTRSDRMYRHVAENLSWYGFVPIRGYTDAAPPERTSITYNGASFKGSYNWLLSWIFRQEPADIRLFNDRGTAVFDYQVMIGTDYNFCLPLLDAPRSSADVYAD